MRFVKMHGAGNDYVYVDGFREPLPDNPAAVAVMVSDRHTGIGSDGLILIGRSDFADAEMQIFNADGSQAEMCGNGIRCVAKYLYDRKLVHQREMQIATGDGIRQVEVFPVAGVVHDVRVDMGIPRLDAPSIPTLLPATQDSRVIEAPLRIGDTELRVTCVSMGNPHCVVFSEDSCDADDFVTETIVRELGAEIERSDDFPERVNVEFVHVGSDGEVHQRTWERGSGETLACGTGACAVCVAGVLTGRTQRQLTVHLKGGILQLEWDSATDHVWMMGPAVEVFRGEIDVATCR